MDLDELADRLLEADPLGDFLSGDAKPMHNPNSGLPSWAKEGRKVYLRTPYDAGEGRAYSWGIVTNELGPDRVAIHPHTDGGEPYHSDEVDFDLGELEPATFEADEIADADARRKEWERRFVNP